MSLSVKHVVKLVEVGEVSMRGELTYECGDIDDLSSYIGWKVDNHNLEEWLEKFKHQRVVITIRKSGLVDESAMIAGSE